TYCLPQTLDEEWEGYLLAEADGKSCRLYLAKEEWGDKAGAIRGAEPLAVYGSANEGWFRLQLVPTALPVLEITTEGEAAPLGEETVGSWQLFQMGAENSKERHLGGKLVYNARGASSLGYEKKNYSFHTKDAEGQNLNVNLLGLRDDDDWKLFSASLDPMLCREKMANDLWNQMAELHGGPTTNRMEYLELYLDGEYKGVYTIAPRLDQETYGLTDDTSRLYKYALRVELPEPWALSLLNAEQSLSWDERVKLVWPKQFVEEVWAPLNDYFCEFVWQEGRTCVWEYAYPRGNFINMLNGIAWRQVTLAVDNNMNNTLYLQYAPEEPLYRIPYDNDRVFGISTFHVINDYTTDIVADDMVDAFCRLRPLYMETRIGLRWQILRRDVFSDENIARQWEENKQVLLNSGALAHNASRWGGSVEESLALFDETLALQMSRMAYLDGYMMEYRSPALK
ncbi:MAG: CotH kinase family protein, partial [Oscillospiraceae bacterium]|nr:CotH kinase family protein [Oscillospiraceae bacterium]